MDESHLLLIVTLRGSSYYYSYFVDEEIEHREGTLLPKTAKLGSGVAGIQNPSS